MKDEIFREKSIEKVKSPEGLDDYIRVANPAIWVLLVAIIILVVGASIFGYFYIYRNL